MNDSKSRTRNLHDGCGASYHARDQECYYRELRLHPKCLAVWKRLMMGQYEHQNNNTGNGWKHITYIQKNMSL